ncbi:MAG TPA: DTW domain-containing protein, partial [Polyangiales bacterium]|nr:DTW domain-containing protein [Polyangiales bacterium]
SNSARLAALWLSGGSLHVRGAQGLADPAELLARPGTALLFPGGNTAAAPPRGVTQLIVPDGTWSQALRIERRWFAAAGLPRLELEPGWPSAYGLRRSARSDKGPLRSGTRSQLCTFEAVAIALGVLGERELACTLLARFAEWARRARWLKSGGPAPGAACEPPPGVLEEHPAARLLVARQQSLSDASGAECG